MEIVISDKVLSPGDSIIILLANPTETSKEEIFRYKMPMKDENCKTTVKRIEIGRRPVLGGI